jgi:hypothetical protein
MTQDEIIVLANKAGWDVLDLDDGFGIRLKEFAALVEKQATALEREACAKVVEDSPSYDWHKFACETAFAIRARGQA